MSRETLVGGQDFESGWIKEITFEKMFQHHYGVSILMKGNPDDKRFAYLVHEDNADMLKREARQTLTNNNASTGSAYNDLLKHADVSDAVGLGRVADFDDEE